MANIKELLANMIGKINGKLNAPEQAAQPHQQLVTDADGVAKWEDRTHYILHDVMFDFGIDPSKGYDEQDFNGGTWVRNNPNFIEITYPAQEWMIGNVMNMVGLVVAVTNADEYATDYVITSGDIDENGNLTCKPTLGSALLIDNSTGVIVVRAPVHLEGTMMNRHQCKAIEIQEFKTIDPKYLPTIVFKKKIGAAITCNVDFATFESRLSEGAAMVMVNDGDYGLETSSNLSAYYDSDNSYWVIHAEFNSETKYYNILFSANSLSVELK